jgi:hypothetical protein
MRLLLARLLGKLCKKELLNIVVEDLYNTIGADDILHEEHGEWYLEDKPVNEGRRNQIISEANIFLNSKLWEILQSDIKYQSNKLMYVKSKTEMDIIAGKLWLYTLDNIKTRLESLEKERGILNI